MKKVVCFASGQGSNIKVIHDYFIKKYNYGVHAIVINNPKSPMTIWAPENGVELIEINNQFYTADHQLVWETETIQSADIIVLAGFLRKIPIAFLDQIDCPMINIHPSLLPLYGGKGMYGHYVHDAVIANKDNASGITIHFVNQNFDEGNIIFQATCTLSPEDNVATLQKKIQELEHTHFAPIIDQLIYKKP